MFYRKRTPLKLKGWGDFFCLTPPVAIDFGLYPVNLDPYQEGLRVVLILTGVDQQNRGGQLTPLKFKGKGDFFSLDTPVSC